MDDMADDREPEASWTDARAVLGDRLLRYLIPDTAPQPGNSAPVAVPQVLQGIVTGLIRVDDPDARRGMAAAILLQSGADSDSLGNSLRRMSGGDLPIIAHQDSLTKLFAELLLYLYPGILAHAEDNSPWWSALAQYAPLHNQCIQALLDSSIGQVLYPDGAPDDPGDLYGGIICDLYSTSHSGSLQVPILLGNMVQYACIRMKLWGDLDLSLTVRAAEDTIQTLKNLVHKKPVDSPCIFTIDGVCIEGQGDAHAGKSGVIATPHGSIGFTTVPTRLLAVITRDPANPDDESNRDRHNKAWQEHHADLHRARDDAKSAIDRVRLAIILAARTENSTSVRPQVGQWVVYSPFGNTIIDSFERLWSHPDRGPRSPGSTGDDENPEPESISPTVSRDSFQEAMELCKRVSTNLDIGVSRIVRATIERDDPVDSFIDAIICWENLIGASPETTFRVCAAIAHLIHPDAPSERFDEFEKMKRMYSLRSKVVHGSKHLSSIDAFEKRDYAIDIALRAMRAVLARPDLVALKNGRSDRILVGAQGLEH